MTADRRPLLTVGYSCLASRLPALQPPPAREDVEVTACVQGEGAITAPRGVDVVRLSTLGVARSRNAALDRATGRYLLFCDDDVSVDLEQVTRAIRHLRTSGAALALGRAVDPHGVPRKRYPKSITSLTLFNSAKAATYEMLVDVDQVRAAGLRFDVRFGAGAPVRIGDEYIFIADLLRAGLRAHAVPWVFGTHPVASSGHEWGTELDTHHRAVVLNRVFGRASLPVRLAFALRNAHRLRSPRLVRKMVLDSTRPLSIRSGSAEGCHELKDFRPNPA